MRKNAGMRGSMIHATGPQRTGLAVFVTGATTITGNRIEHNDGAGIRIPLLQTIPADCFALGNEAEFLHISS